ncbi:hypothetical protein GCM10009621_06880 [Corynebacterium felinum]
MHADPPGKFSRSRLSSSGRGSENLNASQLCGSTHQWGVRLLAWKVPNELEWLPETVPQPSFDRIE